MRYTGSQNKCQATCLHPGMENGRSIIRKSPVEIWTVNYAVNSAPKTWVLNIFFVALYFTVSQLQKKAYQSLQTPKKSNLILAFGHKKGKPHTEVSRNLCIFIWWSKKREKKLWSRKPWDAYVISYP